MVGWERPGRPYPVTCPGHLPLALSLQAGRGPEGSAPSLSRSLDGTESCGSLPRPPRSE